jgi:hypothetical protein
MFRRPAAGRVPWIGRVRSPERDLRPPRRRRIRIVYDDAEPRHPDFVHVLKLHMQLDPVTPQSDVVVVAESKCESKAIDIEPNCLRKFAGAKNRLDLTEHCGVHV